MSALVLFGIAFSLSMDAFAVSVTSGCAAKRLDRTHLVLMPLSFGIFQAVMPVIGWGLGSLFQHRIQAWDHWIAFVLLSAVGIKMIYEAVRDMKRDGCEDPELETMGIGKLLTLSVATSIDALAVGISFSILSISILVPVLVIGLTTAVLCVIGVRAGRLLQHVFSDYAQVAGGIVLVVLGVKILMESLA